jgi:hypothetical protein
MSSISVRNSFAARSGPAIASRHGRGSRSFVCKAAFAT